MLYEKVKRTAKIEILAKHPNNRQKESLKYYKAGHDNGQDLSFIVIVGDIIDVEEGQRFDWRKETHLE